MPTYEEMVEDVVKSFDKAKQIREFASGATRSPLSDKIQYEGFLSPIALQRFGEYMREHQVQTDGTKRQADNWQKGIPLNAYMDSMARHFFDVWLHHRGFPERAAEPLEVALCGLFFNVQGYLHETLKAPVKLAPGTDDPRD